MQLFVNSKLQCPFIVNCSWEREKERKREKVVDQISGGTSDAQYIDGFSTDHRPTQPIRCRIRNKRNREMKVRSSGDTYLPAALATGRRTIPSDGSALPACPPRRCKRKRDCWLLPRRRCSHRLWTALLAGSGAHKEKGGAAKLYVL